MRIRLHRKPGFFPVFRAYQWHEFAWSIYFPFVHITVDLPRKETP